MVKRPTGSDGEPSSPNCGASAGVKARHLIHLKFAVLADFVPRAASRRSFVSLECVTSLIYEAGKDMAQVEGLSLRAHGFPSGKSEQFKVGLGKTTGKFRIKTAIIIHARTTEIPQTTP
jgi:hypothetical protein